MSGFKKETKKCCGAMWDCDDTYQPIMCFFFLAKFMDLRRKISMNAFYYLSFSLFYLCCIHSQCFTQTVAHTDAQVMSAFLFLFKDIYF